MGAVNTMCSRWLLTGFCHLTVIYFLMSSTGSDESFYICGCVYHTHIIIDTVAGEISIEDRMFLNRYNNALNNGNGTRHARIIRIN
jgi:hypothetical protein